MSPEPKRQDSRRASASNSKPYMKTMPNNSLQPSSQEIAQPESIPVSDVQSQPGFPTYAHYKRIEAIYINSMSPGRREKMVITQAMFNRIWDVLNEPDTPGENAQFRFWARKMFSLGTTQHTVIGPETPKDSPGTVLIHDKLPVAIQEQFYHLLCYCHGNTNHGGRDKTRDLIRRHYSWVPKELIAQFVKICPTCILKKSGNPDLMVLAMQEDLESVTKEKGEDVAAPSLPALREFLSDIAAQEAIDQANRKENSQLIGGSLDDNIPSSGPLDSMSATGLNNALEGFLFSPTPKKNTRPSPSSLSSFASSSRKSRGLQSLPMSREISLFKGLPNGWQYHTDYATAYADFMRTKDLPVDAATQEQRIREKRPRVPSILPLRDANFNAINHRTVEKTQLDDDSLPPLINSGVPQVNQSPLPASLQALRVVPSRKEYIPQIDPILLAESYTPNASSAPDASNMTKICSPIPRKLQTLMSTPRAAAPPPLDLSALNTMGSHESFQKQVNIRDQGTLTPDSPLSPWTVATPSSSGSADSCSSHLSAFPTTVTSSSSPATTVFSTPLEEASDKLGKELADTTGGLHLSTSAKAVCGMNIDGEK